MKKYILISLLTSLTLAACGTSEESTQETSETKSAETTEMTSTATSEAASAETTAAAAEIKEMGGDELAAIQADNKEKEKYLVIDVRSEEEYDAGHVKHAINIPLDGIEAEIGRIADYKDEAVVLICNTGNKSGQAAQILVDNGFTNVYNAEGVKDFEYPELVTYETILPDEMAAAVDVEGAVIVDARDQADFDKSSFPEAIKGDAENPEAIIATLPADKATPIYVYCYSGNKSSVQAIAIAEAGYTNVYNAMDGTKEFEYNLVEK